MESPGSQCDPAFKPLLDQFVQPMLRASGRSGLESTAVTIFGMWPDLTLAYTNPGWKQFARENEGEPDISTRWSLGRCVLEAISEPLQPYFRENYGRCVHEMRPWEMDYDCSSPAKYRRFHMVVYPLGDSQGLLSVNSRRVQAKHRRKSHPPLEAIYRDEDGVIVQCAHCRRIERPGRPGHWDWVPEWTRTPPPRTTHGLCGVCCSFYYSTRRMESGKKPRPFSTDMPQ